MSDMSDKKRHEHDAWHLLDAALYELGEAGKLSDASVVRGVRDGLVPGAPEVDDEEFDRLHASAMRTDRGDRSDRELAEEACLLTDSEREFGCTKGRGALLNRVEAAIRAARAEGEAASWRLHSSALRLVACPRGGEPEQPLAEHLSEVLDGEGAGDGVGCPRSYAEGPGPRTGGA